MKTPVQIVHTVERFVKDGKLMRQTGEFTSNAKPVVRKIGKQLWRVTFGGQKNTAKTTDPIWDSRNDSED